MLSRRKVIGLSASALGAIIAGPFVNPDIWTINPQATKLRAVTITGVDINGNRVTETFEADVSGGYYRALERASIAEQA